MITYQNKLFRGPHNKKRGSYRKRPYGGNSSQSSNQSFSSGGNRTSKPSLIRFPLIQSEYKARQKDQALAICIQSLLSKNTIERVENEKSLGFYSRLFLVPKPHQRWRPVIDLSRLNTLKSSKWKLQSPSGPP